jgi:hypothetical protein
LSLSFSGKRGNNENLRLHDEWLANVVEQAIVRSL